MSLWVLKFGGTSVGDPVRIGNVASLIERHRRSGIDLVIVVSAMAGETDRLIALAHTLSTTPDPRELAALVVTGEQTSAALLALTLNARGIPSHSYTAWQIGLEARGSPDEAIVHAVDSARLHSDLKSGIVPVVCGFQGIDAAGDYVTLGRGGSDTTAVALAAALCADECQIYTDVDGVYTADPRLIASARRHDHLSYSEMLELAGGGAKVLERRSVELAGRHRVPLRVLSTFAGEGSSGTRFTGSPPAVNEESLCGVTLSQNESEITILGVPEQPALAAILLGPISAAGIEIDLIVQNRARDGRVDLGFTVPQRSLADTLALVRERAGAIGAEGVISSERIAKLSLVGLGLKSHPELIARLLSTLAAESISVRMMATAEIKVSVTIPEEDGKRALVAVHRALGFEERVRKPSPRKKRST
ncbi:MAG: aspartate kinase [Gammaproteobacteria bacterium]